MKKIVLSIVVMFVMSSVAVYANGSKKIANKKAVQKECKKANCPDKANCKKTTCPNRPGCICN